MDVNDFIINCGYLIGYFIQLIVIIMTFLVLFSDRVKV